MKGYYIGATTSVALSLIAYPFLNRFAIAERGYDAIGGEECVILLGVIIAVCVLQAGLDRKQNKVDEQNGTDEQSK